MGGTESTETLNGLQPNYGLRNTMGAEHMRNTLGRNTFRDSLKNGTV